MADYLTEKKPMSFEPPKSKPFDWKTYNARGAAEEKRKRSLREERDTNQPSDMGFDLRGLPLEPRRRLANKTPHAFHSYREISEPNYKNYPGGFEGARNEALAYRKKNKEDFSDTGAVALAPRLQYDWTMDRKNPIYLSESDHPRDTPQQFTAGTAWIDKVKDKKDDADYTAIDIYPKGVFRYGGRPDDIKTMFNAQIKRGVAPSHVLHEELTHSTQPPSGANFRDKEGFFGERGSLLPYAARNAELGAKLTGEKQKYIRDKWGLDKGTPGRRSGSFTDEDAKAVINKLIESGYSADYGLRLLLKTEKGREYFRKNKAELIKFMMSTASNDRRGPQIPGMNTGPNRYA